MKKPFVLSNYPRAKDDFYRTVDKRCTWALLEHFPPGGLVVDPCAPSGSGIVDALREAGYTAEGRGDAFEEFEADMIASNPPYSRQMVATLPPGETGDGGPGTGDGLQEVASMPLVDAIIWAGVRAVAAGRVKTACYLLRPYFSFALSREEMFEKNPYYFGEIKMYFRPRWKEYQKGDDGPIHHFVWQVWSVKKEWGSLPLILYSKGEHYALDAWIHGDGVSSAGETAGEA